MQHINSVWTDLITETLNLGNKVHPRGHETLERLGKQTVISMDNPIITIPERKLGYKFMVAEAFWILSGDNRVETIAPYSKKISQFSDDGIRFFGAYGPKVVEQMSYVVNCLKNDDSSRQALMTIWRERPGPTKDVPCTVALQFFVRQGYLHCVATMRSNDIWTGFPYDVFNFSMISWQVLFELRHEYPLLKIGNLYLTAGSSHLYGHDFEGAREISRRAAINPYQGNEFSLSKEFHDLNIFDGPTLQLWLANRRHKGNLLEIVNAA